MPGRRTSTANRMARCGEKKTALGRKTRLRHAPRRISSRSRPPRRDMQSRGADIFMRQGIAASYDTYVYLDGKHSHDYVAYDAISPLPGRTGEQSATHVFATTRFALLLGVSYDDRGAYHPINDIINQRYITFDRKKSAGRCRKYASISCFDRASRHPCNSGRKTPRYVGRWCHRFAF